MKTIRSARESHECHEFRNLFLKTADYADLHGSVKKILIWKSGNHEVSRNLFLDSWLPDCSYRLTDLTADYTDYTDEERNNS